MTSFNEREQAFEAKFAHDADLKFKILSRRNKLLAEWAAGRLGLRDAAADDYLKQIIKTEVAGGGEASIIAKLKTDLSAKGVVMTDADLAAKSSQFLAQAVADIAPKAK